MRIPCIYMELDMELAMQDWISHACELFSNMLFYRKILTTISYSTSDMEITENGI